MLSADKDEVLPILSDSEDEVEDLLNDRNISSETLSLLQRYPRHSSIDSSEESGETINPDSEASEECTFINSQSALVFRSLQQQLITKTVSSMIRLSSVRRA